MYCMLECVHCGVTKGKRWCDKGCDKGEEVV